MRNRCLIRLHVFRPYLLAVGIFSIGLLLFLAFRTPQVDFNTEVRPILNQHCLPCHGGVRQSGGFSLLFPEDALSPTESGKPAILPGDPANSELIKRIEHHDPEYRMPLDAAPLSKSAIKTLKNWIKQGAEWDTHWAYIAPDTAIELPAISNEHWPQNGIDHFIHKRLDQQGLRPSAPASRATLLRRISLDLTGLPPTTKEAEAFLNDTTSVETMVDYYLASPHFGEKWASHWLDLARYADSKGYEKDLNRSIWKYRDWVIDAFNRDLPFDQFTIEQLAGDLLPQPTQAQLLATAFHRNTVANDEGGTNDEEFRVAAVVDRVATTFEVWQGTTMGCVQCHSHPYDPIRHEEFYGIYAFFNQAQDRDIYPEHPNLFTYEKADSQEVEQLINWLELHTKSETNAPLDEGIHGQKQALLNFLGHRQIEAETYDAASRFIELTSPDLKSVFQIQDSSWIMFEGENMTDVKAVTFRYSTRYAGGFVELRLDSLDGRKIGRRLLGKTGSFSKWQEASLPLPIVEGDHDLYVLFFAHKDRVQELLRLDWLYLQERLREMDRHDEAFREKVYQLAAIQPVATPIMRDLPAHKARKTHVFQRGNWLDLGEEVSPGVPGALPSLTSDSLPNRLDLARWLVSPANPLTARVTVNRFWEQLFGRGLVSTVEDFGTQGDLPSHPLLLDWLAGRFVHHHGWSMKSLLKEILLSATYQQTSAISSTLGQQDPQNRWLGRMPRLRLSAEQVRDQALALSGLLNDSMHGPPVLLERIHKKQDPFKQTQYFQYAPHRRAIYGFWKRSLPNPVMVSFDNPTRNVCASRRVRTNTPLQALILLNDSLFFRAAFAIAKAMDSDSVSSIRAAVHRGYQRLLFTSPSPAKLDELEALYWEALMYYEENEEELCLLSMKDATPRKAAFTLVANVLLNLDEMVVKK